MIITVNEEKLANSRDNDKIIRYRMLLKCFIDKLQILTIKIKKKKKKKIHDLGNTASADLGFWYIDLCMGHKHFTRGMNLQFSEITIHMHFFTF